VQNNSGQSLKFTFTDATKFLGFSAEEQARLLNGKSVDDPEAFTKENIGGVTEALAQLSIGVGLMIDDPNAARIFMRDTSMPGLGGQSITDCILSRSPQKIARAIKAMETRLDLL
jgi:hypothetical protein